ncbi:MAG: oxidoreductase [Halioglobus sp.]|nr:oxidoreductase [Halioglobus sp.]|tara:strand:+ start:5207 stop:6253 length:1047 start_codon:yes stop_codon:yes gene_type:complete
MKKQTYGIGLVGIGMGGVTHATQFAEIDELEFVACFGRNPEKAEAFGRKYGAKRWYSDFDAFCADDDLDFVVVCTPNGLHAKYAIPLAEAGKHLIVEKPLEISREAAHSIIDACEKNNVSLSTIYQMRFGEAATKIKQAVAAGELGDILQIDAYDKAFREVSYYRDDAWRGTVEFEGGGTLTTQTTHLIDLMQWIGGPVESVYADCRTAYHDIEVEDLANVMLKFQSGANGVIVSSTCFRPAMKSRIEIHGTKGSAIFNGEYDELYFWQVDGDPEKIDAPEGFTFGDVTNPYLFPMERHRANLLEVLAAHEEGRESMVSGREALKAEEIILAIYESSRQGKRVDVRQP